MTTSQLLKKLGVSRRMLTRYTRLGWIPAPEIRPRGPHIPGVDGHWPDDIVKRVKWAMKHCCAMPRWLCPTCNTILGPCPGNVCPDCFSELHVLDAVRKDAAAELLAALKGLGVGPFVVPETGDPGLCFMDCYEKPDGGHFPECEAARAAIAKAEAP